MTSSSAVYTYSLGGALDLTGIPPAHLYIPTERVRTPGDFEDSDCPPHVIEISVVSISGRAADEALSEDPP